MPRHRVQSPRAQRPETAQDRAVRLRERQLSGYTGAAQSGTGSSQHDQAKGAAYQNRTYYGACQNAGGQNPGGHTNNGGIHNTGFHSGAAGGHAKKAKKPMTTGKKWAMAVVSMAAGLRTGRGRHDVRRKYTGQLHYRKRQRTGNAQLAQTQTTGGGASESESSSESGTGTVASVAENAMPSLVTISTMSVEEMRNFFGGTQQYEVQGAGTGVIVGQNDKELLIATNNHVVEGATSLSVGFIDEQSVEGQVKGTDVDNDLAVVAVKLSDIPDDTMNQIKVATVGDSDDLKLGDQVVAIGNALGYGQSVTSGYVSALDRDLTLTDESGNTITSTGLIQTDAAINSGTAAALF